MTLQEYLQDYASTNTKEKGDLVIQKEIQNITNPLVCQRTKEKIEKMFGRV